MKVAPVVLNILACGVMLIGASCTFGLVHTRESTRVRLYLRSAADAYGGNKDEYDSYAHFLRPMKEDPRIVAMLTIGSSGRHVEIVSPEGIFPKWNDGVTFYLYGPGIREISDGQEWVVYRIPENLKSHFDRYTEAALHLSKDHSTVILELKPDRKHGGVGYADFSGRYTIDEVIRRADQL